VSSLFMRNRKITSWISPSCENPRGSGETN
jgi:hypothetical protein